jgi:CheY-like chemotaxis protein/c-di-GMP-binding flagellar brake protein YcgR
MAFRALLVSQDDQAIESIAPVLSNFGLSVQCCGYADAIRLLKEQKFEAVLADFDDPQSASAIMNRLASGRMEYNAATIALLRERERVRSAFGAGANFVLYKPVTAEEAEATLRSAIALMLRERRNSPRVSVQVPVQLRMQGNSGRVNVEGILLDISESGMDVLASQPLCASARLITRLTLPDSPHELEVQGEVAWANPNGESGVRFLDVPDRVRAWLRAWVIDHSHDLQKQELEQVREARLTDLSLGGCYVETASPLPERTAVRLLLRAGTELDLSGAVIVMHPARGMGIAFRHRNSAELAKLDHFIHSLGGRPGGSPEISLMLDEGTKATAEPVLDLAGIEDPLLALLRGHETLNETAFFRELRKQRTAELVEQ